MSSQTDAEADEIIRLVRELFPPSCAVSLVRVGDDMLTANVPEIFTLGNVSMRRIREFKAGRIAAATSLRRLGSYNTVIAKGNAGQPIWPHGYIGSISHNNELALAVVAKNNKLLSLGIDVEAIGHLEKDVWPEVFTVTERITLGTLNPAEQSMKATIKFCAKEAFFKLQYQLTEQWVDFESVSVHMTTESSFYIIPNPDLKICKLLDGLLQGKAVTYQNTAVVGMFL